jgi:hypothetical protein
MRVQYRNFSTTRPFGVEGEYADCGIDRDGIAEVLKVKDPNHKVKVSGWDNSDGSCWHVKTDSTCGWEVASYKGSGIADLTNISGCLEAVAMSGGFITSKCGLHVHTDVSDFSEGEVARVVAHWMRAEPVIFAAVPKHRKRNVFCKMLRRRYIKKIGKVSTPWKDADFYQKVKPYDYDSKRDRRVSLNICNFEKSMVEPEFNRKTLELRLPEMTSEADDIKNWVRFFVTFVENTRKIPIPCDMSSVSASKVLYLAGLHAADGEALILSDGLFRTKEWFLYRLLKYAENKKLCGDAITMLNSMWHPLRKYSIDKKSGVFTETI